MFTKNKVGQIIEFLVYGIIVGAIVVSWLLPEFGLKGISPWIGGGVGAVLGVIYGFAKDDE